MRKRGRSNFPASREPDVGSIPGSWDCDPGQRQTHNRLSRPGAPQLVFFSETLNWLLLACWMKSKLFSQYLRSSASGAPDFCSLLGLPVFLLAEPPAVLTCRGRKTSFGLGAWQVSRHPFPLACSSSLPGP